MEDTPKRMIRAAASFFSGTMLSRITGLLRDMSMAFAFGTDAALAAFLVAFRLAHLLRRLFGESTLQTTFIPQFEDLRSQEKSPERAVGLFIHLYIALTLFLCLLIGLGITVYGLGIHYEWMTLSSSASDIVHLSFLMLPSLLFICLAGLNASLLQCERCYFLPGIAPVAFNITWIIGAIALRHLTPTEAMPKLALWVVVACFFQWIITIPKVISILRGYSFQSVQGFSIFSRSNFIGDLLKLWKPFILGIIGIGAMQINSASDALFAVYAESSGPAFLWFAIRLQQLPLALFGIALSGALLPPLARAIKTSDFDQSDRLLKTAIEYSMLLIIPMTVALFLFGNRSIDLLYGYGDFGSDSVIGTTSCLWGYAIGLIPMTLVMIAAPLFFAKSNYKIPTKASIWAMLSNFALNGLFVFGFNWGVTSIALATSISAWINLIYLITSMEPAVRQVYISSLRNVLYAVTVPLLLAISATWTLHQWFPYGGLFLDKALSLTILSGIFASIFLIASYIKPKRFEKQERVSKKH